MTPQLSGRQSFAVHDGLHWKTVIAANFPDAIGSVHVGQTSIFVAVVSQCRCVRRTGGASGGRRTPHPAASTRPPHRACLPAQAVGRSRTELTVEDLNRWCSEHGRKQHGAMLGSAARGRTASARAVGGTTEAHAISNHARSSIVRRQKPRPAPSLALDVHCYGESIDGRNPAPGGQRSMTTPLQPRRTTENEPPACDAAGCCGSWPALSSCVSRGRSDSSGCSKIDWNTS